MTRKRPASTVDRSLAVKYLDKAVRFKTDAEKMLDLTDEFSGNGIGVLCIHAAIAYGDAIAILAKGQKSKSADHREAAPFLASVVAVETAEDKAAMRAFKAILSRKDEASYMDDLLNLDEAQALLGKLHTFSSWAEKTFRNLKKGMR